MTRLTNKELREEYISILKYEKYLDGGFAIVVSGLIAFGILKAATGLWLLWLLLPLAFIALAVSKISWLNTQIKHNSGKEKKK